MTEFSTRALTLAVLAALSGCSMLNNSLGNETLDYRSQAKQTRGLDVPPDLSQLPRTTTTTPGSAVSAAALATQPTTAAQTAAAAVPQVALNNLAGAEIVRTGNSRIIRTSQSPESLWPVVRTFWTDLGFDLPKEQAEIGILETDWRENRAKLPQDLIRRTIGTVFDGLYSTGERDKFRTRIERVGDKTEITVTHRGMQEIYTGTQKDQTVWTPRASDSELEAEMVSRLLLRLGGKANPADSTTPGAAVAATPKIKAAADTGSVALADVPNEIILNEGFESAWRRVGLSLDRHGFTLEDRDRRAGLFFLRYADPRQAGKDEPNFIQKLFGSDKGPTTERYRVAVKSEGNRTTVMVQNSQGQQQTHEQAKRILALLWPDLR